MIDGLIRPPDLASPVKDIVMQNIVGMFESRQEAQAAIERLPLAGAGVDAISVAIKDEAEPTLAEAIGTHDLAEEGTAVGALSGAAVGTLVGLLIAGSTFVLPGGRHVP